MKKIMVVVLSVVMIVFFTNDSSMTLSSMQSIDGFDDCSICLYTLSGEKYNSETLNASISDKYGIPEINSVDIDSKGYLHVTWIEYEEYNLSDVFYAKWDGKNWVTASGEIFNFENKNANVSRNKSVSESPQVIIDSADNPHIAWYDGKHVWAGEFFYIKWNGSDWVTVEAKPYKPDEYNANISQNKGLSFALTLVLDSTDKPHFVWADSSYEDLNVHYMFWNGVNLVNVEGEIYDPQIGNTNVSQKEYLNVAVSPMFGLSKDGYPHITWIDNDALYGLTYVKWNGEKWVTIEGIRYDPKSDDANIGKIVDMVSDMMSVPIMRIDSKDNPHFVWCRFDIIDPDFGTLVMYVSWDGEKWVTVDRSAYDPVYYYLSSAVVSGYNTFCYANYFTLDSSDNPHISWLSYEYGIQYVHWDGLNWLCYNDRLFNADPNNAVIVNDFDTSGCLVKVDSSFCANFFWLQGVEGNENEYDFFFVTTKSDIASTGVDK